MGSSSRVPLVPRRGVLSSRNSVLATTSGPAVALSKTPIKVSSSRSNSSKVPNSNASHSRSNNVKQAAPNPINQLNMDAFLESELEDAIFQDPDFTDNFLSGDSDRLSWVLERCRESDAYDHERGWKLPEITSEHKLYAPVHGILNTIKRHVKLACSLGPEQLRGAQPSSPNDPPTSMFPHSELDNMSFLPDFEDFSNRSIRSDEADTANLKPDIVLFESHKYQHWETVRMPVEVKKLTSHHKVGMKQLSRYARAVFAHQLHRCHLYGVMVCGSEVTFVRFDRAGIIYSPRIDLCKEADKFTRAFASLLMLDDDAQGYDTAFTTTFNKDGRMEYYVDLPEAAFSQTCPSTPRPSPNQPSTAAQPSLTRRFKVIEKLCHRKSICGRATIVLRLRRTDDVTSQGTAAKSNAGAKRKVDEMEQQGSEPLDYVLKITWRDPGRRVEGEMMRRLQGMYGLAQYVWHCDVPGPCRCSPRPEERCSRCVKETARLERPQVCDNLRDVAVAVPSEPTNGDPPEPGKFFPDEYWFEMLIDFIECVDTTQAVPTSDVRMHRIYSYILMSSLGTPLWTASSPTQFMTAILDAVLGYWRLVNLGILHRDISEGNVMMLDEKQTFEQREWQEPINELDESQDPSLIESEKALRAIIADLGRDPTGMLSDFDLHAVHSLAAGFASSIDEAKATYTPAPNQSYAHDHSSSKRFKPNPNTDERASTVSRASVAQFSASASRMDRNHSTRAQYDRKPVIDFRTGTTAFMSRRVLRVNLGQPYHHGYLDDLESFFWLILWSVAAHIDKDGRHPTSDAQEVLESMNQSNLKTLARWKKGLLSECDEGGEDLQMLLDRFENTWASDTVFSTVIVELGEFFHRSYAPARTARSLVGDFSYVVDIIRGALAMSSSTN